MQPNVQQKLNIWRSKTGALLKGLVLMGIFLKNRPLSIRPKQRLRKRKPGDKLRIAIVTEYYYPNLGGITEHVHHFAQELLAQGHEVKIITPEAGPFGRDVGEIAKNIIKIGQSVPIYSNDSYACVSIGRRLNEDLEKTLTTGNFDIVHVHSPLTPTLPLLSIRYAPCPVVGTFHTHFNENIWMSLFSSKLMPYMEALALRIAVSPVCVRSLERYFPEFPFVVIPNGIDVDWYNPKQDPIPSFADGFFNILYVGRFDPRNGLDILIEAFEILAAKYPRLRLIIIGYGPLEPAYRKMVPEWLKERIIFVGRVDEERPAYFRAAHVLCFPAKKGSFGITLLEAMASGVPVVTTDIEGFRFVMENGKHGLMVPEEEGVSGYVRALEYLIKNPEAREEMSQAARLRAEEFSWPRVAAKVLDNYYQILA